MSKTVIGARVAPEVAKELRRRADLQESTVSKVAAGVLRRGLERVQQRDEQRDPDLPAAA